MDELIKKGAVELGQLIKKEKPCPSPINPK